MLAMVGYFAFAALGCAVQVVADETAAELPHKSLMRRKETHSDTGAMTLAISDSGGFRDMVASSEATQSGHSQEFDAMFSRASKRYREVIKTKEFLEANHEAFRNSVENVRKLAEMMSSSRVGAATGNFERSSVEDLLTKARQAHKYDPEKEAEAKGEVYNPDGESKEEDDVKESSKTYCNWDPQNKTCDPNLDYAYGPMDDPIFFNAYADAQVCWKYKTQPECFGRGCAWRDETCNYAVPNITNHAIAVKYIPSHNCGWFAKLERPRKCPTYSLDDCPTEMEPCTNGFAYMHHGSDPYCGRIEVCDSDQQKMFDFLCEEPLVDIYIKCFTEVNAAGHKGTERERKEVECVRKECPDYAAMLEFGYSATKLCPRYAAEIEGCERQSNCSYDDVQGKCVPDAFHMMLQRVPKECKYYDTFKKLNKCSTTMQSLCKDEDCEWVEASPCTENDTVPQFECDVRSSVLLKTFIDNTEDEHLLSFVQAVTAKEICRSNVHEEGCKKATPMQRYYGDKGAAWRPTGAILYKLLIIATIPFGWMVSVF